MANHKVALRVNGMSTIIAAICISAFAQSATAATPSLVQLMAGRVSSGATISTSFAQANTYGNLSLVYVIWSNTSAASVRDRNGNTYASAGPAVAWNGGKYHSQIFYAKNIAAGANAVTVTFGTAVSSFGIAYIHEYSGVDPVSPLDAVTAGVGTASSMSSGSINTSGAGELLFGAGVSLSSVTAAGSGYQWLNSAYGNITEGRMAASAGTYNAAATQNGAAWAMHLAAFKAASGFTSGDTTPPSAPTGLTANATSSSQINLSWKASTDGTGVAGYQIFRNSAMVATTTATSYTDTGLAAHTTYKYTVLAYDAAGNKSAQSSAATATTLSGTTSSCTATRQHADYSSDNGSSSTASVTANVNAAGDLVAITAWCYPNCKPVSVTLGNQTAVQSSVSGNDGSGNPGTGQGYVFYVLSAAAAGQQTLKFTASGSHSDIQTSYIDFSPSAGCSFIHRWDYPVGAGTGGTANTPTVTPTAGDLLFNFTYSTEHVDSVNSPWSCPTYNGYGETQTCEFVNTVNAAAYILSAPSGSVSNNMTLIHSGDSWQSLIAEFSLQK